MEAVGAAVVFRFLKESCLFTSSSRCGPTEADNWCSVHVQ